MNKLYLTCAEIAPLLGVTPGAARKRANLGQLPALKDRGRIVIPVEAFRAWQENQASRALANVAATQGEARDRA